MTSTMLVTHYLKSARNCQIDVRYALWRIFSYRGFWYRKTFQIGIDWQIQITSGLLGLGGCPWAPPAFVASPPSSWPQAVAPRSVLIPHLQPHTVALHPKPCLGLFGACPGGPGDICSSSSAIGFPFSALSSFFRPGWQRFVWIFLLRWRLHCLSWFFFDFSCFHERFWDFTSIKNWPLCFDVFSHSDLANNFT